MCSMIALHLQSIAKQQNDQVTGVQAGTIQTVLLNGAIQKNNTKRLTQISALAFSHKKGVK